MRIKDVVRINNEILAYCVGDDIPADFDCKRIMIGGRVYRVLKSGSSIAFCGKMYALMSLDLKKGEEPPFGEFIVLQ